MWEFLEQHVEWFEMQNGSEIENKSVCNLVRYKVSYILFISYRHDRISSSSCYCSVKENSISVTIFHPAFLCSLHIEVIQVSCCFFIPGDQPSAHLCVGDLVPS
jgi:hypothetical protein